MSPFSMTWRIALFACVSGLSGTRTWPDALIPCLAVGVMGLLLDRRLRQAFPEGVSLLATLALITAIPMTPATPTTSLDSILLFVIGSGAFLALASGMNHVMLRTFAAFVLALVPTMYVSLRSSWWDVSPWNALIGVFGARGLFYTGPLLWGGLVGLLGLARGRSPFAPLCSGALLGGFVGLAFDTEDARTTQMAAVWLPFFLPGIAWCFAWLRDWAVRRPQHAVAIAAGLMIAWNLLFMEQYRRRMLPSDDTVSFTRVTSNSAAIFARRFGTPNAWPANWVFAKWFDAPVDRWDAIAGRRLFATPRSASTTIELGDDSTLFAPDKALMLEGFRTRRTCGQGWCRDIDGGGRMLLPLQNPGQGAFLVTLRVRGKGSLSLSVNGRATVVSELSNDFSDVALSVPAGSIEAGVHVLTISISKDGQATLDRLTLTRDLGNGSAT